MNTAPLDVRVVANCMLSEAERRGVAVTNLALQKLLYFAHGTFLNAMRRPLVTGYFEAWQYGPVHPTAYQAFKPAGSDPICFRATGMDVLTGRSRPLPELDDPHILGLVEHVMRSYGSLSPGRLVDLSHAKDSPWHFIVEKSRRTVTFGLRIPDSIIAERFKYHKVSVGFAPKAGEPREDTPFA